MAITNGKIRTAVIDVGTLKSKFEVRQFDVLLNSEILCREKELTVMGRDLDKTNGLITRCAVDATTKALNKFADLMEELNVNKYRAVTTEAIRKAKNSKEVLEEIKERTGMHLDVISHEDEAKIYFESTARDFSEKTIAVTDVGGGSVQVVIGRNKEIYEIYLFKTGTYFMQEILSKTHFPTFDELENAKKYVKCEMKPLSRTKYKPELIVYGSTNIIDFLKAMKVKFSKNNGTINHPYKINKSKLYPLYEKITQHSYEDRMPMFPAEPYYMWSAENALLNVFQICDYLEVDTVVPSNNNISSGILFELAMEVINEKKYG